VIRAVLDTNIIVSALGWGGAPGQVLEAARTGRFIAVTSPALLTELTSVLAYPKLRDALTMAEAFLDRYRRTAQIVLPEHRSEALADEDDNRLVEAAEAASTGFIVTGDRLVLDADPIGDIRVVTAREFLTLIDRLDRT
jgi:uncharacterized protein